MKGKIVYRSHGEDYFIDGKEVSKEEFDETFPPKPLGHAPALGGNTSSCWPLKSDAMAVHPSQIKEAMERNKKHGVVGVSYDPKDGRAILADRGARRDLMKLEGFHDKSGGYGDDHHISGSTAEPELSPKDLFDESSAHAPLHKGSKG